MHLVLFNTILSGWQQRQVVQKQQGFRTWFLLHSQGSKIPHTLTVSIHRVLRYLTHSLSPSTGYWETSHTHCLHPQGTEIHRTRTVSIHRVLRYITHSLSPSTGYWDTSHTHCLLPQGTAIPHTVTDSILRVLWYLTDWLRIHPQSTEIFHYSEDVVEVILWNIREFKLRDVVVRPRELNWILSPPNFKPCTLFHVLTNKLMNYLHSRTIIWDISVDNNKIIDRYSVEHQKKHHVHI